MKKFFFSKSCFWAFLTIWNHLGRTLFFMIFNPLKMSTSLLPICSLNICYWDQLLRLITNILRIKCVSFTCTDMCKHMFMWVHACELDLHVGMPFAYPWTLRRANKHLHNLRHLYIYIMKQNSTCAFTHKTVTVILGQAHT